MTNKIVGEPHHLMDVSHPADVLPWLEIGYTAKPNPPTVIVNNTRTQTWAQRPADCAIREAIGILVAAVTAIDDDTVLIGNIVKVVGDVSLDDLVRLSGVGGQISLECMRRRQAGK